MPPIPVTTEALSAILDAHPLLSGEGYPGNLRSANPARGSQEQRDEAMATSRRHLLAAADRVQTAAEWLARFPPVRRASATSPGSYGLKHVMEREIGTYVSNGEFIAAALHLGLPIHVHRHSPNPGIGINRRALGKRY